MHNFMPGVNKDDQKKKENSKKMLFRKSVCR